MGQFCELPQAIDPEVRFSRLFIFLSHMDDLFHKLFGVDSELNLLSSFAYLKQFFWVPGTWVSHGAAGTLQPLHSPRPRLSHQVAPGMKGMCPQSDDLTSQQPLHFGPRFWSAPAAQPHQVEHESAWGTHMFWMLLQLSHARWHMRMHGAHAPCTTLVHKQLIHMCFRPHTFFLTPPLSCE